MKLKRVYSLTLYTLAFFVMIIILFGCKKENQPPTCKIIDPLNGENIPHGTQVTISVDAVDKDGVIYGINYYLNNSNIGILNRPPYNFIWNTLDCETGNHSIKATSTDDSDNSVSDEIFVSLTEGFPEAEFDIYQTSVSPDSSAQFYNRSINNPTSWVWDFGDGGTAYAKNPSYTYSTAGTYNVSLTVTNSYGSDTETKPAFITVTDPVTDYNGNVYQTVQIGNQIWMRENLKATHYADGTALINGKGAGDLSGDYTTRYYFDYNDEESYVTIYGRLYTWAAAMNGAESSETNPSGVQGVCPSGWHMPSDNEWKELEMYLGMAELQAHSTEWRGTNEGLMLKEIGDIHWLLYLSTHIPGTNESGFTALPGGSRGYNEVFGSLKFRANFWSASESISSFAWCRRLYNTESGVYRYDDYKSRGYSVRCVKD